MCVDKWFELTDWIEKVVLREFLRASLDVIVITVDLVLRNVM